MRVHLDTDSPAEPAGRVKVFLVAPASESHRGGQAVFARALGGASDANVEVRLSDLPWKGILHPAEERPGAPARLAGVLGRAKHTLILVGKIVKAKADGFQVLHIFASAGGRHPGGLRRWSGFFEKLLFVIVGHLLRLKVLFSFRSDFARLFADMPAPGRRFARRVLSATDGILVQYEGLREQLLSFGFGGPSQIAAIPNGIDPALLELEQLDRPAPSPHRDLIVLYLGQLMITKGIDVVAGLAEELARRGVSGWRLRIGGAEEQKGIVDQMKQRFNAIGCEDRVSFEGWVAGATKRALLVGADVVVMPSRAEGFPNVALEAMLSGCVVVATPVGALPDLISDGVDGFLVDENSPSAFASRIELLMANRALLGAMGSAARKKILEHFTLDTIRMRYWTVYRGVAAGRTLGEAIEDGGSTKRRHSVQRALEREVKEA